ncbi:MAG: lytic murein transglycosylase [Pseudomonadota bacterium]
MALPYRLHLEFLWLAACVFTLLLVPAVYVPARAQGADGPLEGSQLPIIEAEFQTWLSGVAQEGLEKGLKPETLDQALGSVTLNQRVLKSSVSQPERKEKLADYLAKRISIYRVQEGRRLYLENKALVEDVAEKTGVDASVIIAIWGIETAYGKITGDAPVIDALASLGFRSDRKAFFRKELFQALTMLDRGLIDLASMKGSWAGAMGQPQFIPSSYLSYARDYDGDGIVDIWNNLGDVFYSIGSYLQRHGWQSGQSWGVQATVSDAFRASRPGLPDRSRDAQACVSPYDKTCKTAPLRYWLAQGVVGPLGGAQGLDAKARVVMPDGARGPAFLAPKNFDVILTYNRSSYYAVSVGMLADMIAGAQAALQ